MLNRLSKNNQGLSRKDIEYWRKAEIESAKLSANMSDEQKEMLEQRLNGSLNFVSNSNLDRLVDIYRRVNLRH